MALAARINGKKHKIFCLMGDGEQQEGQVWEAAMEAGHFHLDDIIAVIDVNGLQIDGLVKDVMQVQRSTRSTPPLAGRSSTWMATT